MHASQYRTLPFLLSVWMGRSVANSSRKDRLSTWKKGEGRGGGEEGRYGRRKKEKRKGRKEGGLGGDVGERGDGKKEKRKR